MGYVELVFSCRVYLRNLLYLFICGGFVAAGVMSPYLPVAACWEDM